MRTGRAAIDMKHIKRDFSLKAWVQAPWMDIGGGAEVKMITFLRVKSGYFKSCDSQIVPKCEM